LLATPICLLAWEAQPTWGLEDGRIGLLYAGCIARSRPFWLMRSDPLFRTCFVPATLRNWAAVGPMAAESEAQVRRLIRLYMPRTLDDISENFDVIVLSDANVVAVGPYVDELAKAVSERGVGLLMGGGWESFGGSGFLGWGGTPVGDLLPVDGVPGSWETQDVQKLVIDKPEHELISSIPWDMKDPDLVAPIKWHHNLVTLKLGAEQLAHLDVGPERSDPVMVTWELPAGSRVFALTSEIHRFFWQGGQWGNPWRYGYDLGCNLVIYLAHRPVPQDVFTVHAARSKMLQVSTRRSLLLSLIDFCESFGANTRKISSRLGEVDQVIQEAMPQYLQLRFEDVLQTYRKADQMLQQVEAEAVKLKERTLLWVYTVEWLAVTGTLLCCGFILWSLMIRRKMYREVSTTRMAG